MNPRPAGLVAGVGVLVTGGQEWRATETFTVKEGHSYELLNDIGKEHGMAAIQNWMNAGLPVT